MSQSVGTYKFELSRTKRTNRTNLDHLLYMASSVLKSVLTLSCAVFFSLPSLACTIFVLTDSKRTLFFNNEDFSNPATRIWFLPGTDRFYGTAYLGFDNNWAQGGVNTKGLAFDWVAGTMNGWKPAANLLRAKGNPSERMLENCATVEEAIAFFQKYAEPSFSYARILIADKSGASVIIGARDGKLYFDRSKSSRGFGYGGDTLQKMLSADTKPSLEVGLPILKACVQKGGDATKYSNVFDLTSGEVLLMSFSERNKTFKFNLKEELSRGGHYYDLPQIGLQMHKPLMPLQSTMTRFLLDSYKPIKNEFPTITKKIKRVIEDATEGTFNRQDFNPEFWRSLEPYQKDAQKELKNFGKFKSLTLLENVTDTTKNYLFAIKFKYRTLLQRYFFDQHGKISGIKNEGSE